MEPFFLHLHPSDAFSRQVRVDGGELATESPMLDDLLDGSPQLLHAPNVCVDKEFLYCKFALVTLGGATSAIFQYFQDG